MGKLLVKLFTFLGLHLRKDLNGNWQLIGARFLPLNWIIVVFLAIALLNCLNDSWFILDKTEKAAVEYFGAYSHEVGPGGLHWKVPFITEIRKVPTEMRHRWELGFRSNDKGRETEIPAEATMLTKGGHIGSIYWIFQYTINDVYTWVYTVKDPVAVLDKLGQGSMRLVSGQTLLDDFLTTQKIEIQENNKKLFQNYCNTIGLNVTINEVKLQDCDLPDAAVKAAYSDVMNAEKDKDAMQQKAQEYHNKVVPEANGKAVIKINEANAYYTQQVNGAKGEIALFMGVLEEYRKDPLTTERKLWYEAMKEVLPEAKKTIIENQGLLNFKQY